MKKKLVALTLSAVMALSLIGCGSQGSGGNQESSKEPVRKNPVRKHLGIAQGSL